MRRILLACSSGMSTSLLVTKMEAYAKSIGEEVEIRAVGQDRAKSELKKVDVVLIGPQMSFFKEELQQAAEPHRVPVEVIDRMAYGMADGKAVYEQAVRLMGGQNE